MALILDGILERWKAKLKVVLAPVEKNPYEALILSLSKEIRLKDVAWY